MFSRPWGGTEYGCYEQRWIRDDFVETYSENGGTDEEGNDTCDDINPISGMIQTQFLGKFFCGVEGGKPFHSVTRVDA